MMKKSLLKSSISSGNILLQLCAVLLGFFSVLRALYFRSKITSLCLSQWLASQFFTAKNDYPHQRSIVQKYYRSHCPVLIN